MMLNLYFDFGMRWWLSLWFAVPFGLHSVAKTRTGSATPIELDHLTNAKSSLY